MSEEVEKSRSITAKILSEADFEEKYVLKPVEIERFLRDMGYNRFVPLEDAKKLMGRVEKETLTQINTIVGDQIVSAKHCIEIGCGWDRDFHCELKISR